MYLDYFFYICLLKSVNKKSKVVEHIQKAAKMNPNLFQSSGLLNVFYFFFALFFYQLEITSRLETLVLKFLIGFAMGTA